MVDLLPVGVAPGRCDAALPLMLQPRHSRIMHNHKDRIRRRMPPIRLLAKKTTNVALRDNNLPQLRLTVYIDVYSHLL